MFHQVWPTVVRKAGANLSARVGPPIDVPQEQTTGIGGDVAAIELAHDSVAIEKVSPSVVQVVVDCYSRESSANARASKERGDNHVVGSGAIIDPSGYIITNAHVVENAWRIRVRLTAPPSGEGEHPVIGATLEEPFSELRNAILVGTFKEGDLALIKIEASGLPALKFADYWTLRQGQVVFAFGSREGLHNSVSMGVVSSVARQLDENSPFIYIQTDAAINPGDSGGPLVNTAGEIVGLDTLILRNSGGSEGLGVAIPSTLVKLAVEELREHGHFHRRLLGVGVQSWNALPRAPTLSISSINRTHGFSHRSARSSGPFLEKSSVCRSRRNDATARRPR
jgi:serine protease Do